MKDHLPGSALIKGTGKIPGMVYLSKRILLIRNSGDTGRSSKILQATRILRFIDAFA